VRHFPALLLLLASIMGPGQALAQYLGSARGAGMSAVRGDPVGSSAVIYNPAGLSRALFYAVEGQYFRAQPEGINLAGVTVVDSRTQPQLAVGITYGYQFTDKSADLQHNGQDIKVAMAHAAVPERLHLGFAFRYIAINRSHHEDLIADAAESATELAELDALEGFTLDAGLLFSPSRSFHIGLVGQNLIDLDDPSVPMQAGGGIAYTGRPVVIAVDGMADFSTHPDGVRPVISAGTEVLFGELVPFRLGYTFNGAGAPDDDGVHQPAHWVSGGIGFLSAPRAGKANQLTISYRHNLTVKTEVNVGLGLIFYL
jgi:hypothetical protein